MKEKNQRRGKKKKRKKNNEKIQRREETSNDLKPVQGSQHVLRTNEKKTNT